MSSPAALAAPNELSAQEQAYQEQVQRDLPRNFLANLAHGMLGLTGFKLMHAPTFVPAYIFLLSDSKIAVGLALGAQFIGMAMSSIWSATLIEHREQVMDQIRLLAREGDVLRAFPTALGGADDLALYLAAK